MVKKDAKYKKLDNKQSRLKTALHQNRRDYYDYRVALSKGIRKKAPISMSELEKQEKEINLIRKKLDKKLTTIVRDLKKTLKHL